MTPRWTVLLDRDGTINRDTGYVHRWEDFEFLPGIVAALQQLALAGAQLAIITNQAGIARGLYTPADFQTLMTRVCAYLQEHAIPIAGVYHCPHHRDGTVAPLAVACDCRKPQPGLILRALHELHCDPATTVYVGDQPTDIEAAHAAGIDAYWLCNAPELSATTTPSGRTTYHVPTLAAAADHLLARMQAGGEVPPSNDTIILAGGKGTRLASVVTDTPKALALINGVPFLQYQCDLLARSGCVSRVICALGHQADAIREFCRQVASRYPFPIDCVVEEHPLGTGGAAVLAAHAATTDAVFVLNGDTYCDWPLAAMQTTYTAQPHAAGVIACRWQTRIDRYGYLIRDDVTGRIARFAEKPAAPVDGYINVGAYLLDRQLLCRAAPRGACSMEYDLLPAYLERGLYAVPCAATEFIDIGTPESYAAAHAVVR